MSLNPITAIEKLINEHGSATVLRERLSLAADQFTALEKENIRSEKRLVEAEKGLAEAMTKIAQLESRNADLEKQLSQMKTEDDGLSETQIKILKVLHQHEMLSTEKIADAVGLSAPDSKGHLCILAKLGHAKHNMNMSLKDRSSLGYFHITTSGRAEAMKNG